MCCNSKTVPLISLKKYLAEKNKEFGRICIFRFLFKGCDNQSNLTVTIKGGKIGFS